MGHRYSEKPRGVVGQAPAPRCPYARQKVVAGRESEARLNQRSRDASRDGRHQDQQEPAEPRSWWRRFFGLY
jgi:hypothetical protein